MTTFKTHARLLTCLVIMILSITFAAESHGATLLFDNLNETETPYYARVGNNELRAQAFSTTTTDFVISAVSLRLWNDSGTTGTFELQIWDSLGPSAEPGSQVGSALYSGLAQNLSDSSSLLSASGLSVTLAPSTTYYLVPRGVSLTDVSTIFGPIPGTLKWGITEVISTDFYARGAYAESPWIGPDVTSNVFMQVTAVPEPTTWGMGSVGLACGGWYLSRRRRVAIG